MLSRKSFRTQIYTYVYTVHEAVLIVFRSLEAIVVLKLEYFVLALQSDGCARHDMLQVSVYGYEVLIHPPLDKSF